MDCGLSGCDGLWIEWRRWTGSSGCEGLVCCLCVCVLGGGCACIPAAFKDQRLAVPAIRRRLGVFLTGAS